MIINMTNNKSVAFFNSIIDDGFVNKIEVDCEDGTQFSISKDVNTNKFMLEHSITGECFSVSKDEVVGYLLQYGDTIVISKTIFS